jgi:hypothetical protein
MCYAQFIVNFYEHIPNTVDSGFGGLGVACWPLVPKLADSYPSEAVGFLGTKKSSARLPSEGIKAVGPTSQLYDKCNV